jgi:hypothetical protein
MGTGPRVLSGSSDGAQIRFEPPALQCRRRFSALLTPDFAVFRSLRDLPIGMTAHVVYAAGNLVAPATTSVSVIGTMIRDCIGIAASCSGNGKCF